MIRWNRAAIDRAADGFDAATAFWATLTGWGPYPAHRPEFRRPAVPDHLPVRILVQRTDTDAPPAAHLDLACADIEATAAWHESLGARRIGWGARWLVMHDPSAVAYCLTDPFRGRMPS